MSISGTRDEGAGIGALRFREHGANKLGGNIGAEMSAGENTKFEAHPPDKT